MTAPRRRWSLLASRAAFVVLIAIGCFAAIAIRALWPVAAQAIRERERRENSKKNLGQFGDALKRHDERQKEPGAAKGE